MKIFLIDDDPDYHQFIEHELAAIGGNWELQSCLRAEDAIRLVPRAQPAQLYMVDWRFVGEVATGFNVIQAIFAVNPAARIVLSTHIQPMRLEPRLMELITGGQITLLEKYTNERLTLEHFAAPGKGEAKILILDDDPDDALLLGDALTTGSDGRLTPVIVTTPREGRQALETENIKGYVVDYRLQSNETGIDFITSLPRPQRQKPTVLITGMDCAQFDTRTVRLLANGEFFMLHKSAADPHRLCHCLGHGLDSEHTGISH